MSPSVSHCRFICHSFRKESCIKTLMCEPSVDRPMRISTEHFTPTLILVDALTEQVELLSTNEGNGLDYHQWLYHYAGSSPVEPAFNCNRRILANNALYSCRRKSQPTRCACVTDADSPLLFTSPVAGRVLFPLPASL